MNATPKIAFRQYGKSGISISDLLPLIANVVDNIWVVESMHTEAIHHDPAITFFQSGQQQPDRRPS